MHTLKHLAHTLLLTLLLATPSWATTYYVATSGAGGSDSNSCVQAQTVGTAKLTWASAITCLTGGDELIFKAGSYLGPGTSSANRPPSGTSVENMTTIRAATSEAVTFTTPTAGQTTFQISGRQYIKVQDVIIDGTNGNAGVRIANGASTPFIHLINVEIKNAPGQGILVAAGGDDGLYQDLNIHNNGQNDLHHGIYMVGDRNIIRGGTYHLNAGWGIHLYSGSTDKPDDNIVEKTQSYDNAQAVAGRGVGIGIYSGQRNIVRNNFVWGNADGIFSHHGAVDTKIFNNTAYGNTGSSTGGGTGIYLGNTTNAEVRNNISYGNGTQITDLGTSSTLSNNLTTDPGFVNVGTDDYRITTDSDAHDAGATIASVVDDFFDTTRAQGLAYDIGAHEVDEADPDPPAPDPPTAFVVSIETVGMMDSLTWTIDPDDLVGITHYRIYVNTSAGTTTQWYRIPAYSALINPSGTGIFNKLAFSTIVMPSAIVYFRVQPVYGSELGALSAPVSYDNS